MVHRENGPFLDLIITLVKIIFVVSILITTTMSEEKKTKECPYCGEEILATAKKCKHCGEWLEEHKEKPLLSDEEIDQIAEDAVNEVFAEQEEEEKKEKWREVLKNLKILGIFALFLFLLIFTVPSESRFINSLNRFSENYVQVYASEVNRLCANNGLASLFGEKEKMEMVEQVKANYANMFSYENELFFGTGKLDDQLIMVGALGIVVNLGSIFMSEEDIRAEAVKDWDNGLKYSAAAGSLLGGIGDVVNSLFDSSRSATSSENAATAIDIPLVGCIADSPNDKVEMNLYLSEDGTITGNYRIIYDWGYETSGTFSGSADYVDETMITIDLESPDGETSFHFFPIKEDLSTNPIVVEWLCQDSALLKLQLAE